MSIVCLSSSKESYGRVYNGYADDASSSSESLFMSLHDGQESTERTRSAATGVNIEGTKSDAPEVAKKDSTVEIEVDISNGLNLSIIPDFDSTSYEICGYVTHFRWGRNFCK